MKERSSRINTGNPQRFFHLEGVPNAMAKKNILQFVLLGLLNQHELAGYDIKKLFDCEIGDFWHSKHSQIYPELRRLEEAQLITARTEIIGQKLEKKFYSITEAGRAILGHWLEEPLEALQPTRDEFTLKLYLINDKHHPHVRTMFEEEIALHEKKYAYLKDRRNTLFASKERQEHEYGHYLILEHAVMREKSHLDWLKAEYVALSE